MDFNMLDCLFCKIVNGEIPSTKVYEDENFLGFLDIYPVVKGHVLLIPKHHVEWMQDDTDENIEKIFVLAKKLMSKIKTNLACDFVQISIVGEDVPHFHIHFIPRFKTDNMPRWDKIKYDSNDEMLDYAKMITK